MKVENAARMADVGRHQPCLLPKEEGAFDVNSRTNGGGVFSRYRLCVLLGVLIVMSLVAGAAFAADASTAQGPQSGEIGTNEPGHVILAGAMDGLDEKQRLAVGDRVSFRVLQDQEDAKLLTVTDAGELDVPELGLVMAVGKTCGELAREIKSKLEKTTYYKATVIIGIDQLNKTLSGRKVYVVGQVKVTGPQEIPAGETWTVSKAILKAGGFTDFADKKRVRVVRAGAHGKPGKTIYVNVTEIWEKGRTDLDVPVVSEDLIYVPARAVNFY